MLFTFNSIVQLWWLDKVVCYWGTWSVYRWGNGKFTVDDIDPTLCTHMIYTFVGIQRDGNIRLLDEYLDIDLRKSPSNPSHRNLNLSTFRKPETL